MDYKNGQIYTIRSHQTDLFYIGSTCSPLAKRMGEHRGTYKYWNPSNTINYVSSFEIMKYGDAYIELLEDFPCKNKKELNKREGQLIRFYGGKCINKNVAGRTHQEYLIEHKIEIYEKQKEYYITNQEQLIEKQKEYYITNQEQLIEKAKQYYSINKIKINEKHTCECGSIYSHQNKSTHLKTKKHKNYLSTLQDGQVQVCKNE